MYKFNQSKTSLFEPVFLSLTILNIYQINTFEYAQKQKHSAYLLKTILKSTVETPEKGVKYVQS